MFSSLSTRSLVRVSHYCQCTVEFVQTLQGGIRAANASPAIIRPPLRNFTTSQPLEKKGGKPAKQYEDPANKPAAPAKSVQSDPFDFTEFDANIAKAHTRLKEELSKLRGGGRFNTDLIDQLRVHLEKGTHNTVRLGDLAQVVPKGRIVNVIVGEREHVKVVSSAIQGSDLSLTPQQDAENALQLNITIPSPTAESRQHAVESATKFAGAATMAVRKARDIQNKKLTEMRVGKKARPDELKKAGTNMEKTTEAGLAEVKKITDSAKKVLET